jgi:hypothetical protein
MGFYKQHIYGTKFPMFGGKISYDEAPTIEEIVADAREDEAFQTAVRNAKYYDYAHYESTIKEILRLTVRYLELYKQFKAEYKAYKLNEGDHDLYEKCAETWEELSDARCTLSVLWGELGVPIEAFLLTRPFEVSKRHT